MRDLLQRLARSARPDSYFWRRAIAFGVHHGPDPFVRHSPRVFGAAFAAALPAARARVIENLRLIHGQRPRPTEIADAVDVFQNYASCLTEAMLLGARRYRVKTEPRGVERYFSCAKDGRGVLLATAHTGGWEMAGHLLSGMHRGEVVIVMRRERDDHARDLSDRLRQRTGVTVVHVGDDPLEALQLIRHLRNKAAVAVQIDRLPEGMRSRRAPFFSGHLDVPEGLLTLAAMTRAPILPIFTRRLAFMHYEVVVEEPIRIARRPDDAALDAAAHALASTFERFVRESPTQWFHFQ